MFIINKVPKLVIMFLQLRHVTCYVLLLVCVKQIILSQLSAIQNGVLHKWLARFQIRFTFLEYINFNHIKEKLMKSEAYGLTIKREELCFCSHDFVSRIKESKSHVTFLLSTRFRLIGYSVKTRPIPIFFSLGPTCWNAPKGFNLTLHCNSTPCSNIIKPLTIVLLCHIWSVVHHELF